MIYVVFLIRTDTTKEGSGMFIAACTTEEKARALCANLNTNELIDSSRRYVVEKVQLDNELEGNRIWCKRAGF